MGGGAGVMIASLASGRARASSRPLWGSSLALHAPWPLGAIDPHRIVVVTLAVPYKAQVEEYRRALRAKDTDNLSEYPEYRGFVVERRRLALDGTTEEQPWAPLDM